MRLGRGGIALLAVALAFGTPAFAAGPDATQVGWLNCKVAGGWSFVVGSARDMTCSFEKGNGVIEYYTGSFKRYGIDIGHTAVAFIGWAVVAPTANVAPGALAGAYAGVSAGAAFGTGFGANVLFGGGGNSIALQPVSLEAGGGINVAGGIGIMTLEPAREPASSVIPEVAQAPNPPLSSEAHR